MTPPLPLDHPDAPRYWKNESSGNLARAVEQFRLSPAALTRAEITQLRWYFSQWIHSPVWDANPSHDAVSRNYLDMLRAGVGAIRSPGDVCAWHRMAKEVELDPLSDPEGE